MTGLLPPPCAPRPDTQPRIRYAHGVDPTELSRVLRDLVVTAPWMPPDQFLILRRDRVEALNRLWALGLKETHPDAPPDR